MCKASDVRRAVAVVVGLALAMAAPPAAQAALVAHWTFDDTLADATGNGYDGTHTGTPNYVTDVPAALGAGKSLDFNGSSDAVTAVPTGTVSGSYTVAAWAKVGDTGTRTIFSTRQPSDCGFDMKLAGGSVVHGDVGNGSGWLTITADAALTYSTGQWYHVAYTVAPDSYNIYIDGVDQGRGSFGRNTPLLVDGSHHVSIGRYASGSEQFLGQNDDVAVWDTRLSPGQIAALAAGAAPSALVTSPNIQFIPISNDTESGISTSKGYTHKLDFGQGNPGAVVNDVPFRRVTRNTATFPSSFNYEPSEPTIDDHGGNTPTGVTGNVVEVFRDMIYDGANPAGGTATITVGGLIPGLKYDTRIYSRQWGGGNRTSTIGFDTNDDGVAEDEVTINEDNARANPPGFSTDSQPYALSYKFQATGSDLKIRLAQQDADQSWHVYGLTNELVGPAATLQCKMTADDDYALYLSTDDSQLGTLIQSSGGWESAEEFDLAVPQHQTMYLHIVSTNGNATGGDYAGVIGEFEVLSGLAIKEAGSAKLYTDSLLWRAEAIYDPNAGWTTPAGTPIDLGAYGIGAWGDRVNPDFDPAAHWLWAGSATPGDTAPIVFLSAQFTVTPEPTTALLLAGGLLALARRRRRRTT